ncbi:trihelix transcription factor GTL1-like [Pecten maximus]|uniref:trihelix transcription factor GTL1-like n=1 Tax=Pecten maximus TaxID=6579 RepID=UPI001458D99E|nr:trihelix transcription factor GTL1-like [Pecten maximus]
MAENIDEDPLVQIEFDHEGQQIKTIVPRSFANEIHQCYKTDPEKHKFYLNQIAHQAKCERSLDRHINSIQPKETGQTASQTSSQTASQTSMKENTSNIHVWTEKEEKCLIDVRLDKETAFNGSKSHDTLWNEITTQMKKNGINVTKIQIMNKWKNLKKKYKEILDSNSKTGNSPASWKYFEVFNQAYGNKASTQPVILIDSSKETPFVMKKAANSNLCDISPGSSSCSSVKSTSSNSSVNKKRKSGQDIAGIEEMMSKHHREKMRRMDKILNIFQMLAGQSTNEEDDSD